MKPPMMGQAAYTPRQRQEIEPPSLLQSRQEIPLLRLTTSFQTIVTARADAYFLVDGLWIADISASADSYYLCLVAPAGSPTAANAVAWDVAVTANTTAPAIGGVGLLIPPSYTLQAAADANDRLNIFGWGWNIVGDAA